MYIQQIRNATLKIMYGGITFLVDPWLQEQGTGFSAKAVKPEMQEIKCPMNALPDSPENILRNIDYCLVTHLHFDHFSPDYLPQDLRIIAQNRMDAEKIREMGFENTVAFESELLTIGGVAIHKTKAIANKPDLTFLYIKHHGTCRHKIIVRLCRFLRIIFRNSLCGQPTEIRYRRVRSEFF